MSSCRCPPARSRTSRLCVDSRKGPRVACSHRGPIPQTDSIAPGRLLTLVRPGNDLVLRRIRNLKCNKTTPRYAPQFASRLHFKQGRGLPKETPFPFCFGPPFLGTPFFFFSLFSLALQSAACLKCSPGRFSNCRFDRLEKLNRALAACGGRHGLCYPVEAFKKMGLGIKQICHRDQSDLFTCRSIKKNCEAD